VRLLVAGGDRVDAGKTTFAVGLAARLDDPFTVKPRAGNDFWFDHDDARAAVERGRLYGKDVARLTAATDAGPPEAHNPVHRLWRPTPGRTGLLGERGRTFLLDRVTVDGDDRFVVNGRADLPDLVRASLPLAEAPRVDSIAGFNDLMADWHLDAFTRLRDRVRETDGPVVVESYANVADPLQGVAYDAVAVVEPTRCRVYDGRRWEIARDAVDDRADGQLEERVDTVTERLEPVATHALDPLPTAVRDTPERIAAANADAYDALLAAV
jgi:Predicted P-loop ATPase/GTPase